MQETSLCPLPIVALVKFIQIQCPKIYDGGKRLASGDQRVNWYHHHFPRGVICFKILYAGRPEGALPDLLYESIEGNSMLLIFLCTVRIALKASSDTYVPTYRGVQVLFCETCVHSLRRGNHLENWHDLCLPTMQGDSSVLQRETRTYY